MMRIAISYIKEKVKSVDKKIIILKIKESLLYNIIIVFILVFLLLNAIFFIAPRTAHISYTSDEISSINNISAQKVSLAIASNYLFFVTDDIIEIDLRSNSNITINEQVYELPIGSKIVLDYNEFSSNVFGITSTGYDSKPIYNLYSTIDNKSEIIIEELTSRYSIYSEYGYEIVTEEESMHFDLSTINAVLIRPELEEISVQSCELKRGNISDLDIVIRGKVELCNSRRPQTDIFNLSVSDIKELTIQANGDLRFTYTPTASEYSLVDQWAFFSSKKEQLKADIVMKEKVDSITINGIVNKASISEIDLLPSFWGWYRDNIYLAPLTLITTLFGGITLMLNKKKDSVQAK